MAVEIIVLLKYPLCRGSCEETRDCRCGLCVCGSRTLRKKSEFKCCIVLCYAPML
ncbi:UNVERIFIED_CONTAM: hypothetical protein FKN15_067663 [Acipenser sinensis]